MLALTPNALPNVDSVPVRVCNTCAINMNEEKTKAVRVELHILSVSDSSSNDDSRQKVSNEIYSLIHLQVRVQAQARVARVHFCQGYFRRPRVPARAP